MESTSSCSIQLRRRSMSQVTKCATCRSVKHCQVRLRQGDTTWPVGMTLRMHRVTSTLPSL